MAVDITNQITYKRLVAAGNSRIFFEDIDVATGTLIELAASAGDIDTTDQLTISTLMQKVFIANGSNLKVADFVNTRLAHTALATAHARGDILTQAVSGASMIVDHTNTAKTYTYGYTTTGTWTPSSNAITGSGSGTAFTPTSVAAVLTHTALATAHTAGDILTQATTTATMVVESTDAAKTHTYGKWTSGTFNTTNAVTGDGAGTAFTPTAVSILPVLWYDWTVTPGGAAGEMPTQAYLICTYRGRLVLSGNPLYPNQWFMSRMADPYNWLYGDDDPMSAVAGNNADAGQCPDIPRTLISFHDDYLIFGCASTIWILRGDPVSGGSLDNLSDDTGMFGANSYCFDNNRNLYFWGTAGIYKLASDFSSLECISQLALPDIINDEGADSSTHIVTMRYDRKRYGIVTSITKITDSTNSNYFYSLKTGGFYPETYPEQCGIYSMFYYDANDTSLSSLLLGCADGYIRIFDESAKSDDIGASDEAISSYVVYPIMPLSELDVKGKLTELVFDIGGGAADGTFSDSDGITYELFSGDDPETVLENIQDGADPWGSGTFTGTGRKAKKRPRMRGIFAGLKISNSNVDETFAMNRVLYNKRDAGKIGK